MENTYGEKKGSGKPPTLPDEHLSAVKINNNLMNIVAYVVKLHNG